MKFVACDNKVCEIYVPVSIAKLIMLRDVSDVPFNDNTTPGPTVGAALFLVSTMITSILPQLERTYSVRKVATFLHLGEMSEILEK